MKVGVVFGGMSTEKEVSVMSAKSVLDHLDKEKYEIFPIFIDAEGIWYEYEGMKKIDMVVEYLKKMDVIFPVLHGLYGEDGTIQGMFELLKIPYVGCKVLASSVGMDKVYTKNIFEKAKINQAKYVYVKKYENTDKYIYIDDEYNESIVNLHEIPNIVKTKTNYPVFVKPSNSGSSVGVNKAENDEITHWYNRICSLRTASASAKAMTPPAKWAQRKYLIFLPLQKNVGSQIRKSRFREPTVAHFFVA